MRIQPIILSYNLPDETDELYEHLVKDGFEHILVVDNGSDKASPAKSANFLIPWNIRNSGQARFSLMYCMDYFPADYYWIIQTTAQLLPEINYKKAFEDVFARLNGAEVDYFLFSYIEGLQDHNPSQNHLSDNEFFFSTIHPLKNESFTCLMSHKLLQLARVQEASYFNRDLYRGWGADLEMAALLNREKMLGLVIHRYFVKWRLNLTYAKKLDTESKDNYYEKASEELNSSFTRKYGKWGQLFNELYIDALPLYHAFNERSNQSIEVVKIDYETPRAPGFLKRIISSVVR